MVVLREREGTLSKALRAASKASCVGMRPPNAHRWLSNVPKWEFLKIGVSFFGGPALGGPSIRDPMILGPGVYARCP